jgi:hypothetical protein
MTGTVDLGRAHPRVARPTDDLPAVVRFDRDGLELDLLYWPAPHFLVQAKWESPR